MINSQGEPIEASDSAKSFHKMIESFTGMELSSSKEMELADRCLEFQHELHQEEADLTKLLGYGNDAVSSLLVSTQNYNIPCFSKHVDGGNPNRSHSALLFMASILNMMGIACSKLKNYDDSLKYLNWAKNNLDKLERDASCCVHCCSVIFLENQFELYKVKFDTEKKEECPGHMEKILKIKKNIMVEGCVELGHANKDVASAYQLGNNSAAALPYLVKALEIYETRLAHDSPEILQLRMRLSVMYAAAGDYAKAFEQSQQSLTVFDNTGNNSLLLNKKVARGGLLLEPSEQNSLVDAIQNLKQMKKDKSCDAVSEYPRMGVAPSEDDETKKDKSCDAVSEYPRMGIAPSEDDETKKDKSCDAVSEYPRMGIAPSEDDEEPTCSSQVPSTALTGRKQAKSKRHGK